MANYQFYAHIMYCTYSHYYNNIVIKLIIFTCLWGAWHKIWKLLNFKFFSYTVLDTSNLPKQTFVVISKIPRNLTAWVYTFVTKPFHLTALISDIV